MKTKNLKLILIIITIITCISTTCFATNTDNTTNTSSETTQSEEPKESESTETAEVVESTTNSQTQAAQLEQHEGDYSQTGTSKVTLDKIVNGNAYITGSTVNVTGQVHGDLYVFATDSVIIEYGAIIYGNVFVITPNLTLDGFVYSLYAVTDKFECRYEKDKYDGMIALDMKVIAKKVDFNGYIERHVYLISDNINIADDAYILGNLNYVSNNATISDKATLNGETYKSDNMNIITSFTSSTNSIIGYITSIITSLIFVLIILLAMLLVKPNIVQHTSEYLTKNPIKTFLYGLIGIIIIPVLAILCLFVNVLFRVAIILGIIYLILLAISAIIVTIGLAKYIDNKIEKTKSQNSILLYIVIIAIALWILTQIPYLGIIINIIISIFGLGTILLSILANKNNNETPETSEKKEPKKVDDTQKEDNKENNENE